MSKVRQYLDPDDDNEYIYLCDECYDEAIGYGLEELEWISDDLPYGMECGRCINKYRR